MIPSDKKIAGVAGFPVKHSLSPKMHGFWLIQNNVEGSYLPFEIKPENFEREIRELMASGIKGMNVTIPHKEKAFEIADVKDEISTAVKAANTLVFKAGKIECFNTDVYGFSESLIAATGKNIFTGKVVILGAGGAARAIIYAVKKLGFEDVVVINRTIAKAENLAHEFHVRFAPWDNFSSELGGANLLVNTTSIGLKGDKSVLPEISSLEVQTIVYDIVYNPLETSLIKYAKDRGNITINGLNMLIYQGIPGFQKWFHVKPSISPELITYLEREIT